MPLRYESKVSALLLSTGLFQALSFQDLSFKDLSFQTLLLSAFLFFALLFSAFLKTARFFDSIQALIQQRFRATKI